MRIIAMSEYFHFNCEVIDETVFGIVFEVDNYEKLCQLTVAFYKLQFDFDVMKWW